MSLSIVILAAGQGTRMRSDLPKILHRLGGKTLLEHVVDTARAITNETVCVVYGHGGDQVRSQLEALPVHWVEQVPQLGTGHALAQAIPLIASPHRVLVLYGDVPLITTATLQRLLEATPPESLGLLTAQLDDPFGYGRILRDRSGRVTGIVEHKDAAPEQRAIREINTGIMVAPAARLAAWLDRLDNANAQGELYLTDVIAMAVADGVPVHTVEACSVEEILGVNDRLQLAALERQYRRRQAERLMLAGVTLRDPERFDLRGELEAGRDAVIDVGVVLEGRVRLGDRVRIGPYSVLRDVDLGDDAEVLSHCCIEGAVIEAGCRVGPFARIRPQTRLASGAHIGNFVEVKQSSIGRASKVNHLSYIGDAVVGQRVNIGAGTITCNYDGAHKHVTEIGDDVFVGSDTQLVAPVRVGEGATVGAGSTITRNVPAGGLTLSRAPQVSRPEWRRPVKKTPGKED